MGSLSFDRRWVYLGLLLLSGLWLPTPSRADALLVSELSSCLPRHCVLESPLRRRPDPVHLQRMALHEPNPVLLSGLWQRPIELTVLRVLSLDPPNLLKSKVTRSLPLKRATPLRDPGIRGSFRVGQGKELSVALTPTPKHCAPLVEMRF